MKEKSKIHVSAPLPFQGQKRRFVKIFREVIGRLQPKIVVDLFGGSGLLSHLVKHANPQSRVIYNDYDNYCERLSHIGETNKLITYFRELLHDVPEDAKIEGVNRKAVLLKLQEANRNGYVDWLTLSASLKFSMDYGHCYADFENSSLYNKVRMSNYSADGYLDGLEVVHCDYSELCHQYRETEGVLFLADPPYLSTDVSSYNSVEYWTLKDYLNVLAELNGLNYIYFTSNKSQIVDLCEWLHDNGGKIRNIFAGATVNTVKSPTSGRNSYTDIMLYKINND